MRYDIERDCSLLLKFSNSVRVYPRERTHGSFLRLEYKSSVLLILKVKISMFMIIYKWSDTILLSAIWRKSWINACARSFSFSYSHTKNKFLLLSYSDIVEKTFTSWYDNLLSKHLCVYNYHEIEMWVIIVCWYLMTFSSIHIQYYNVI